MALFLAAGDNCECDDAVHELTYLKINHTFMCFMFK